MAIGDIIGIKDSLEFDPVYGTEPAIVNVSGDVFAIAYEGPGTDGWLITLSISADGAIGAIIDSLEFDTDYCDRPDIIHVSGDVFAISYTGLDNDGFLKTVSIANDGTIGTVIDTLEFDTVGCINGTSLRHISGDVFAIAYEQTTTAGILITVDIDSSGNIGAAEIDSLTFATSIYYGPYLIHCSGTIYALGYRGEDNDGFLKTVSIDDDGTIGTIIDTLEFETDSLQTRPSIVNVSGDVYAIAYTGPGTDGWLKTVSIDGSGNIGTVIDSLEFDDDYGAVPQIILFSGDVFAIAYSGSGADGFLKTVSIANDGTIGAVIDTLEFDTSAGYYMKIIRVSGSVYAIPYRGPDTHGWLKTVAMDTSKIRINRAYALAREEL